MRTNNLYAVVFDNDPDFPGQLQFCNVEDGRAVLQGCGTNVTPSWEHTEASRLRLESLFPEINYRVVRVTLQEVER